MKISEYKKVDGKMQIVSRDMTADEIENLRSLQDNTSEIAELKRRLAETDYKAIKYAEGLIGEKEYAAVKKERQAVRNRINELEKKKYD